MSFAILGIGTASPARQIAQADAARLAAGFANAEPGGERALAAIYRQTKIRSRGSVLLEDPGDDAFAQSFFPPAVTAAEVGPTTGERMARYAAEAGSLAIAAARRALDDAGVSPGAVTHLVTCSCTGFANPGVDLELVAALGLSARVARTNVGFMGCHGAFNALRVAAALGAQDAAGVVLVACVELCSLHFQYGARSDLVVANSIFADGAAAVVGRAAGGAGRGRGWRLERQWSQILADSGDDMGWTIGDHGFEMNLSARVPTVIGRQLPGILAEALADVGLAVADVGSWAVHPGGPRVLAAAAEALGLDRAALDASWDVLGGHGNMSSATILFVLDRLLVPGSGAAEGPCVALAFGPGLSVEVALFGR